MSCVDEPPGDDVMRGRYQNIRLLEMGVGDSAVDQIEGSVPCYTDLTGRGIVTARIATALLQSRLTDRLGKNNMSPMGWDY